VVLASADADLREQLGKVLAKADLHVEETDDVVGTELAGCAKNAAALAAAAASHSGPNAAGAAASLIFSEIHDLARRSGGRSETFVGLAGSGDLVGTVLAGHSRNRRAGELLGQGMPAEQIQALLDEAAEGLDSVPLLAAQIERSGADGVATRDLNALVEGRIEPDEWVSHVRSNGRAHAAA
jgi:glycerol-3-phosphate dehydrogenase